MTRKRFIKLLMSRGLQRNQAQLVAGAMSGFGTYHMTYVAYFLAVELNISSRFSIESLIKYFVETTEQALAERCE